VRVKEGRIADWKGGVKDWLIVEDEEGVRDAQNAYAVGRGRREDMGLVNGILH